jgi:hypothetical protein
VKQRKPLSRGIPAKVDVNSPFVPFAQTANMILIHFLHLIPGVLSLLTFSSIFKQVFSMVANKSKKATQGMMTVAYAWACLTFWDSCSHNPDLK